MSHTSRQDTSSTRRRDARRGGLVREFTTAILAAVAGAGFIACDSGITDPDPDADHFQVMTRNLYLGADIGLVLSAPSVEEVPARVGQAWASITANDFRERAELVAGEIARDGPHVVGLQEAALFRIQAPGDYLAGNPEEATEVAYDFVEILLEELAARDQSYQVATVVENIDIELPAATSPTTFIDVRYTDRTVLLVRSDVTVEAAISGNYQAAVQVPVGGSIPVTIPRGWNRADIRHEGTTWTVVNTHLETDETAPQVQELQAAALVDQVAASDHPTVVLGDLNGLPDDPAGSTSTYAILTGAGFMDAWPAGSGESEEDGHTCCFDPDLSGGELFERIDYVFVRGTDDVRPFVFDMARLGEESHEVTDGGLRASDHAGLIAYIEER